VPAGTYEIYTFLDLNNSGGYDVGDIGQLDNDDFTAEVTVSTGPAAAPDITLANNVDAVARVGTQHGKNEQGEWYNLLPLVQSMKKQVINVQVVSGLNISGPLDLAVSEGIEFECWPWVPSRPVVGDTYRFKITYADGTPATDDDNPSETVDRSVTAVLDGLPTPISPVGYIPFSPTPTFSWAPPSPAPAEYVYSLWVSDNNHNDVWDAWAISSSTTSLLYGSRGDVMEPALSDGTMYNWSLNVADRYGNQAQNQVYFTPTSLPAVKSFSPVGGLPGTEVVISGVNLNPAPEVRFNGVIATAITNVTSTSLTVTVPEGATTGKISVDSFETSMDRNHNHYRQSTFIGNTGADFRRPGRKAV
jgi:hypothetical protein